MIKIVKIIGISVGVLALIFFVVMTVLYFVFIDVVINPNNMRQVAVVYSEETKTVQVKGRFTTSAPTHIYDIQIKRRGDRVVIKAYANMLDMEVSENERRVSFDIPIEVGDSINYIQLGRRKKYTIWSRYE